MGSINTYRVYYSGRSSAKVRARTANGARKQAWSMLGGFRYGWSRSDFMRNATVKRLD